MTAQVTETLRYNGEELALCEQPLSDYFELAGVAPPFEAPHTALRRGYEGIWEIVDDRLYLIGLEGWSKTEGRVGLDFLFPDFPDRVFAHWINGTLRATRGKQLQYVHAGFASVYEQDVFFRFDDGTFKSVVVKDNSIDQTRS